jgi:hypothetical protein
MNFWVAGLIACQRIYVKKSINPGFRHDFGKQKHEHSV